MMYCEIFRARDEIKKEKGMNKHQHVAGEAGLCIYCGVSARQTKIGRKASEWWTNFARELRYAVQSMRVRRSEIDPYQFSVTIRWSLQVEILGGSFFGGTFKMGYVRGNRGR